MAQSIESGLGITVRVYWYIRISGYKVVIRL